MPPLPPELQPQTQMPTRPAAPTMPAPVLPQRADRAQGQQKTAQDMELDRIRDARAAEQLRLQKEAAAREAEREARRNKALDLTGGAEPRETEQRNIGLTIEMAEALRRIQDTYRKYPNAVKPGWGETIGSAVQGKDPSGISGLTGKLITSATTDKDILGARQVIRENFNKFVQNAIYSASGAAFQADEYNRTFGSFAPDIFDTQESLKNKQGMAATALRAALSRTGAGKAQIEQKVLDFIEQTNAVYNSDNWAGPQSDGEAIGLSSESQQIKVPPEMQQEYEDWFRANPPSKITPEQYVQKRLEIDRKYFPGAQPIDLEKARQFLQRYKDNPDAEVNYRIPSASRELDDSFVSRLTNYGLSEQERAELTAGDFGAGIISTANAGGFGLIEPLTDMLGEGEKFDAIRREYPEASVVGDIVGSIAPNVGMAKAGAAGLFKTFKGIDYRDAELLAEVLGNTTYGGVRAAAAGGDASDIAGNAALGTIGALGGTAVGSGARGFMGGEKRAALDTLQEAPEIDLTTFQQAGLGQVEEMLQGLPGFRGARAKAAESFNRAEAGNVLRNVDPKAEVSSWQTPGIPLNLEVKRTLDQGYTNLRPQIKGNFDPVFRRGTAAIKLSAFGTPTAPAPRLQRELWRNEIAPLEAKFGGASFDGDNYLDAYRRLRDVADDWRSVTSEVSPDVSTYHKMAGFADKLRIQMRGQLERTNPDAAAKLRALDKAYASNVRIQRASRSALAESQGVYSPKQKINAIAALDTSANKNLSATGQALDQPYAQAAAKIMGSERVPEKLNLNQIGWTALSGAGTAGAIPAVLASAQFLAYAPGVKRIVQGLLAGKRPSAIDNKTLRAAVAAYTREKLNGED